MLLWQRRGRPLEFGLSVTIKADSTQEEFSGILDIY